MAERIPGARRRSLSTRISLSKKVSLVSWQAEVIYLRILPHCDDAGRLTADVEELKATVIPMGKQGKKVSDKQLRAWLEELHVAGLVVLYSVGDEDFLQVVRFEDFQTFKSDRDLAIVCPDPTVESVWNPEDSPMESNGTLGLGLSLSLSSSLKPSSEFEEDFTKWWARYPRKVGKQSARSCYVQLREDGTPPDLLVDALLAYVEEIRDEKGNLPLPKHIKHPATFLGPGKFYEDYARMKGWNEGEK